MATIIANPIYDSVFTLLPNDNVRNRVEELLQVINQSKKTSDKHFLTIDEDKYSGDEEMQEMIRTLKGAACDSDIRLRMQLEDEILGELKNKNLTIEKQKEQLAEQKEQLAEQKEQLAEKEAKIAEQQDKLASLAKGLQKKGWSIQEISDFMDIDEDSVKGFLAD